MTIFDFDTISKGDNCLKFLREFIFRSEMSMNKCLIVESIWYQSTANYPWASDSKISKALLFVLNAISMVENCWKLLENVNILTSNFHNVCSSFLVMIWQQKSTLEHFIHKNGSGNVFFVFSLFTSAEEFCRYLGKFAPVFLKTFTKIGL